MKRYGKLSLKYPLDVTRMQEMDSRNQNFLRGMLPKPPRQMRLWRVVCLRHKACLWNAKPPLTKVWIRPCLQVCVKSREMVYSTRPLFRPDHVFSGWQTPLVVWQHRRDRATLATANRGRPDKTTANLKNWARFRKAFDRWSIYKNTDFWPTKQLLPYFIPETSTVRMPWPTVSSLGWPVSDAEPLCAQNFHTGRKQHSPQSPPRL